MLPVRQFALMDIIPTIHMLALPTATTHRTISSMAYSLVPDLGITSDTRRGSGIAEFTAARDGVGLAGRDMLHAEPMIAVMQAALPAAESMSIMDSTAAQFWAVAASPAAESTPTTDSTAAQFEAVAASMEGSDAKHSDLTSSRKWLAAGAAGHFSCWREFQMGGWQ